MFVFLNAAAAQSTQVTSEKMEAIHVTERLDSGSNDIYWYEANFDLLYWLKMIQTLFWEYRVFFGLWLGAPI